MLGTHHEATWDIEALCATGNRPASAAQHVVSARHSRRMFFGPGTFARHRVRAACRRQQRVRLVVVLACNVSSKARCFGEQLTRCVSDRRLRSPAVRYCGGGWRYRIANARRRTAEQARLKKVDPCVARVRRRYATPLIVSDGAKPKVLARVNDRNQHSAMVPQVFS